MKIYEIFINRRMVNDYIIGRINGYIYILTGMPEIEYGWGVSEDGKDCFIRYKATEEQNRSVVECIEKNYSKAFAGIRVIEEL